MSDVLEAPLAIRVADEDDVAVVLRDMAPDRRLVRPLLVVVPNDTPVKESTHG